MFDCEVFWDLHMYRVSDFYQAVIIQRQDKGMYLPLNLWKVLQCIFKRYFCLLLSIRHWSIMRNTPIHHVIRWNQESSFIQHHVWLWHIYMFIFSLESGDTAAVHSSDWSEQHSRWLLIGRSTIIVMQSSPYTITYWFKVVKLLASCVISGSQDHIPFAGLVIQRPSNPVHL